MVRKPDGASEGRRNSHPPGHHVALRVSPAVERQGAGGERAVETLNY